MIAIVGSPPYAETNQDYTSGFEYVKRQPGEENRNGKVPGNYGQTPGQLAALPPGAVATETRNDMTEITDWTGCYDNGWKGLITDAAFAHPAKFSRNLVFRIIEHLLADGAIQPGDTILDPFGGVGLGALPSVSSGLNWIGCELERKFVDMGAGMDCPGMSKAEWIRFYGRWGKVNYRDDWHWCPDCVTGAGRMSDGHKLPLSANQKKRRRRIQELEQKTGRQVTLFDRLPFPELVTVHKQAGFFEAGQPSTDYGRDGRIPHSHPHHYAGNVELFAKYAKNGATARLLQGDSRRLASVVSGAGAVVGSPPYNEGLGHDTGHPRLDKTMDDYRAENGSARRNGYGDSNAQLSALPPGNPAAVVTSPPFAGSVGSDDPAKRGGLLVSDPKRAGDVNLTGSYGTTPGQLGGMAVVGSPPYEGTHIAPITTGRIGDNPESPWKQTGLDQYGRENGQLGTESGETFWSAARLIVEQCAMLLPPGAPAVWVTKRYVKNGAIVDFSQQWAQLCEACGFEVVHWHRAWLVKDNGGQADIFGDTHEKKVARKSFFRRLAEKNGSPAIDWEDVICTRKRAAL